MYIVAPSLTGIFLSVCLLWQLKQSPEILVSQDSGSILGLEKLILLEPDVCVLSDSFLSPTLWLEQASDPIRECNEQERRAAAHSCQSDFLTN